MSTPLEEIEAAIEKLTDMRDERNYSEINGWLAEEVPGASGAIDDPGYAPVTNDQLAVTLHRTIDAQLWILLSAVADIQRWLDPDSEFGWEPKDGLLPSGQSFAAKYELARAINGGT